MPVCVCACVRACVWQAHYMFGTETDTEGERETESRRDRQTDRRGRREGGEVEAGSHTSSPIPGSEAPGSRAEAYGLLCRGPDPEDWRLPEPDVSAAPPRISWWSTDMPAYSWQVARAAGPQEKPVRGSRGPALGPRAGVCRPHLTPHESHFIFLRHFPGHRPRGVWLDSLP